jgi:alpha-beta hydrolase superfamily lysophospholipase/SAM-dependent methyltransferase
MNAISNPTISNVIELSTPRKSEHTFRTWDGNALFYRAWQPHAASGKAVILFHGGHEHSGRFDDLVERLELHDCSVFAWDARGHGRSPGVRGYAEHFHDFVRDADEFLQHVSTTYGIDYANMVLLGHSVGSVIISTWLQDYARPVRGAVLGSPAFHVKLYAPLALPALRVWQRLRPDAFVSSYVKPGFLTHDDEEAEARRQDELISPNIEVRVLTSLFDTANRVIANAGTITTPILILSAGSDWVVKRRAHKKFFQNLGSPRKALQFYPSFFHEVFHERDRQLAITQAREFILSVFNDNAADGSRFTRPTSTGTELPIALSPLKKAAYRLTRYGMQTAGRMSDGIRLGWQVGFDAGRMLDYVYANRAGGWTPLGRLMDRAYLNSVGWRRIRQRREHLQTLLSNAVTTLKQQRDEVHVLDVAAGPGRLAMDTPAVANAPGVTITCRDISAGEVAAGRERAAELGIDNLRFEQGDAFDPSAYRGLEPRPDIVIVSGLYELFADNERVLRSLHAINSVLGDNGYLIYTNQPHHPQLEFIAATLTNRNGEPWVMRPRSQREMNELLHATGFDEAQMLMDTDGIFVAGSVQKRSG